MTPYKDTRGTLRVSVAEWHTIAGHVPAQAISTRFKRHIFCRGVLDRKASLSGGSMVRLLHTLQAVLPCDFLSRRQLHCMSIG